MIVLKCDCSKIEHTLEQSFQINIIYTSNMGRDTLPVCNHHLCPTEHIVGLRLNESTDHSQSVFSSYGSVCVIDCSPHSCVYVCCIWSHNVAVPLMLGESSVGTRPSDLETYTIAVHVGM